MFSYHAISCPQDGQRERGVAMPTAGGNSTGTSSSSAASCFQPRSSIIGSRCTTTFRKLPISSPSTPRVVGLNSSSAVVASIPGWVQTTWPSLKIGRYIETTMPPISVPRMTMMKGSISVDRPFTASSTSSS